MNEERKSTNKKGGIEQARYMYMYMFTVLLHVHRYMYMCTNT